MTAEMQITDTRELSPNEMEQVAAGTSDTPLTTGGPARIIVNLFRRIFGN